MGDKPFLVRLIIKNRNQNGYKVEVMIITESIPINATKAKECNAGCFAKIKEPMDNIVVKTARIIEILYVGSSFFPVVCSFCIAFVRKILKSSPTPKTKVQTTVLKILSSKPKK